MFTSLQTRLKSAGKWLPLMLLPFAAQAQTLNYAPAGATNVSGTYTDLGTSGTAITTANTDDANSTAQPIGFTFNFNGTAFTQFVLNTNGFIRLGAAAPSGTALFPSQVSATIVDPLTSADPANTNLLMPFNQDLGPGNGTGGTEYRVSTTGTAGSRVCTIQWENVSDKTDGTTASQYANFSFQLKLYEGSNLIEFVYDAATPSTGTATARFPNVGIKGSGVTSGQTVLAAKNASTAAWSTATFITGAYTTFTLNYRANIGPDAGRTFRFAPTVLLNNDVAVNAVFTLGKVSSAYGSPVTAQVLVTNLGSTTRTNLPVTLTVSGATAYTNTQTVASLASGASATVTFTYPVTGTTGTNTLTATVPADDLATNNSATAAQNITANELSHFTSTPAPVYTGGIGSAGANVLLLVRYQVPAPRAITAVTPTFGTTGTGQTYQVVIYSANATTGLPGTVLYTSATRTRPATATSDPLTIPAVNVSGDFFVGIKQITAANIGLAYLTDSPLRRATFYFSGDGITYTDLSTNALAPRLAIDATLGAVLSTRNDALAATVGLFPNPANQRFEVSVPAGSLNKASASLINALGQVVQQRQLNLPAAGGTVEFNVSGLAAGVYSLQLKTGNDLVVKRVVVE